MASFRKRAYLHVLAAPLPFLSRSSAAPHSPFPLLSLCLSLFLPFPSKAGHHINHRFGFGLLDAHKMVELAKTWQLVGPQLRYSTPTDSTSHHVPFATRAESGLVVSTTIGAQDTAIRKLEHVQVTLYLNAQYRGDIVIELEAPSGTRSVLLTRRTRDYSPTIDWTFMTVRHWDEMPVGTWKLYVRNAASPSRTATLGAWSIILYGTSGAGSAPTCAQGQYLAASGECQACDDECTSAGCTGAGPSACISCAHMHTADGECVFDCGDKGLLNPGVPHGQCLHCDDACASTFFGAVMRFCSQRKEEGGERENGCRLDGGKRRQRSQSREMRLTA